MLDRYFHEIGSFVEPLVKKAGIKESIAPYYYKRYPIDPSIKNKLDNLEFPKIDNKEVDTLAVFTDVYPNTYRTIYMSFLAHILYNKGIGSVFLYDNKNFDVCQRKNNEIDCTKCVNQSKQLADSLGLNTRYFDKIDYNEIKLPQSVEDQLSIYADSAASRKLKIDEVNSKKDSHQELVREFKKNGKILWGALEELDQQIDYDYIINYTTPRSPKKIPVEYAKINNKKYVGTTDPGFGDGNGHLFHKGEGPIATYISDEVWQKLISREYTDKIDGELSSFINKRSKNIRQQQYAEKNTTLSSLLELDQSESIYSMYTHLAWDAAADKLVSRVYDSHKNWVVDTIKKFEQTSSQLIIKLHPAEEFRDGNITVQEIINQEFNKLPSNIEVLPPDTRINTYDLIQDSDVILVNTSTVGLESAYFEKPVITVGNAHYAEKGFTLDPSTIEDYYSLIKTPPCELMMNEGEKMRAKMYSYNYFVERPVYIDDIILPKWEQKHKKETVLATNVDDILNHRGLNHICESIKQWNNQIYFKSNNI